MIQKRFKICLFFVVLGLNSCSKHVKPTTYYSPNFKDGSTEVKSGLGFEIPDKFPIEVFYANETPKQSFEVIETITMSGEEPLTSDQTYKGKMLNRGNHQSKKKEILDEMVAKAVDVGASALMDVNYKVYSTTKANGYTFTGKAIRYVLK
jgi:hypothetical protein